MSAVLFLYRDVLGIALGEIPRVVRARAPERLSVVLSRDEIGALLKHVKGTEQLIVMLLYGAGLRIEVQILHAQFETLLQPLADRWRQSLARNRACAAGGFV